MSQAAAPRPPRFSFVPTLGVSASEQAARALFGDGLGLPEVAEDEQSLAYSLGSAVLLVDTGGAGEGLSGFVPLFVTDDLQAARTWLSDRGGALSPVPWAPEAPGFLVTCGSLCFAVFDEDEVVRGRFDRSLA